MATNSKTLNVLKVKAWPDSEGGYTGYFIISSDNENIRELMERSQQKSTMEKYDEFIFLTDNGKNYKARDLWLEAWEKNVHKLSSYDVFDNRYIGDTQFKFTCNQFSPI
jgi:hypothetical protein